MRQVKTKEAWPLCCEALGSCREGFASMLPLQSVRVTNRFILAGHVAARWLKLNLCHEGSRLRENCTFALSFSLHQPQVSTWMICGSTLKLTFFFYRWLFECGATCEHETESGFCQSGKNNKTKLIAFIQIFENTRNFLSSLCFLCELFWDVDFSIDP